MIRPAVASDAPTLAEIYVVNWQTAFRGIVDQGTLDALDQTQITARFKSQIAKEDPHILVSTTNDGQVPVGYLVCTENPRDPTWPFQNCVTQLFVHPDYHGKKIGTNLLKACARLAKERGHHGLMIGAFPQNHGAVRLYQRLGATTFESSSVEINGSHYPETMFCFSNLTDQDGMPNSKRNPPQQEL